MDIQFNNLTMKLKSNNKIIGIMCQADCQRYNNSNYVLLVVVNHLLSALQIHHMQRFQEWLKFEQIKSLADFSDVVEYVPQVIL